MSQAILMEKYRPKSLDQIVGQAHIIPYLKRFVKSGEIPHMMFSGPPGTGKTATAVALARELFGDDWHKCFREFNASDERKLDDVREKIKPMAHTGSFKGEYKIIFLDESDHLHHDAQPALRTIIEKSSSSCRFIFSCNQPNKIIEPIADRLVEFRFKPLKADDMKVLIDKIVEKENISITPEAVMMLGTFALGSMRKVLKILTLIKMANLENVDEDKIKELVNWVDEEYIIKLVKLAIAGDYEAVNKNITELLYEKVYDVKEIIFVLERIIRESQIVPLDARLKASKEIGVFEYRIAVGCNAEIQFRTLMAYVVLLFKPYVKDV